MTKVTINSELGGHKAGDTLDVTPGVAAQLIASEHAEIVGEQPGSATDGEPPRSGRGSSAEKWKLYAQSQGITVPDDADRDAIITLVDEASGSGEE